MNLLLLTILLFISFIVVFVIVLVKGQKKLIPVAIGLFVATAALGGVTVSRLMNKAMTTMSNVEPRSGEAMYAQSFRYGALDCVKIINSRDRTDFFRDCCTWLEIETCPEEINRVLDTRKHTAMKLDIKSIRQLPQIPGTPDWWRPDTLGDSAVVINFVFPVAGVPGIEQKVFLSADSTRAFYYEKMETVFKKDTTDN